VKNLRFEKLSEQHLPSVMVIEKESNPAPWSIDSFRNEINNPQSVFFVVFQGSAMVGFGGIWTVIDEAHVTTVAVATEQRRQGIGWWLMVRLLEEAKEMGMESSTLEVRAGNESAIKLYEKLGYTTVARRKRYYPNDREDALVMWLYELQGWEAPKRK
jgi:ribosomal-protein-alanine N-acetyltransferase